MVDLIGQTMVYVARKAISGKTYYYLVKSIKVGGRVHKLQRYLGRESPAPRELERLERLHASWFEARAVQAKARLAARVYRSDHLAPETLEALEQVRYRHQAARRLLAARELLSARQHFKLSHLEATLALANTPLSRNQIHSLLLEEDLPSHVTLKQVKLLLNLEELHDTLAHSKAPLDRTRLLAYHRLLARGLYSGAGELRQEAAALQGSSFVPLPALLLAEELDLLLGEFNRLEEGQHPLEAACRFHHRWGQLHPFAHANGLLGRELFNHRLGLAGYPPLLFPAEKRRYLAPLQAADGHDFATLYRDYADLYLARHQQILEREGGLERAVRARQGQSRLELFEG